VKTRLAQRLLLACAVAVAAALLSTWWSLHSLANADRAAEHLASRSEEGLDLTAKLETVVREKSFLADYLLSGDEHLLAAIQPHRQQFREWIEAMGGFVRTDEERQLLDRMRQRFASYTTAADDVVRLEREGRSGDARQRFTIMAGDVEELLNDGQQLFALAAADMRDRRAAAQAEIEDARRLMLWLTGIGALVSLGMAAALTRSAARPLMRLVLRLGATGVGERVAIEADEVRTIEAHVNALLDHVRRQERALQQAEKLSELGEIASELAHETLNPVTGVSSMLQALRRTSLTPEQLNRELVDMERMLGRVARTVRRLMSYARPLEPHMHRVSVGAVVQRAVASARVAPGARDRVVDAAVAPADLTWTMDPDLIEQVLVNLLVNGCEASPPGSHVEIAAAAQNGTLGFLVRDHGSGIAPSHRERLFHPFFTTKPEGNGLGLAISRNIVREHGGSIDVQAPDTGGSVFRVTLPRVERP
jgi:signal transduction histidine kinase